MSRSKDVKCPYCGEWQEICHDDGFGYEEDQRHETECSDCDKAFVFTTSIMYHYESFKADCLNGGEHKLKPVVHYPRYFPDYVSCQNCDYSDRGRMLTEEEYKASRND